MRRSPGFRHPRYLVSRLVARGGMGKVYAAQDILGDGREVAVKVYPARANHARLREEFLALKRLHHPGIARALHFGVAPADNAPFFTLELIHGLALDSHVRSQDPASRLARTADLLLQACSAVAYLHRRGVLHLDLKPENILVVASESHLPPRAVIIDFGLVRRAAVAGSAMNHATLPYAPPEVFRGIPPTAASDVYSLAAAFYRTISGRPPVAGTDAGSYARAHRQGSVAPLAEAPEALGRILLRALAKDPARRYRDGGEMLTALLQVDPEHLGGFDPRARTVPFHEPDFVGRQVELAALGEWLERGLPEHPVFSIRAGAGWGKSRFLQEAATLLEARGRTVLSLRATANAGWPLWEGMARHLQILGGESRPGRGKKGVDFASAFLDAKENLTIDEARLFGRRALARLAPLLRDGAFLLVDDLHLASPLEREWIEELALSVRGAVQGGLIIAWSPTAATANTPSRPWKNPGLAREIELGALSVEDAIAVDLDGLDSALARFPGGRAEALKRKLHLETGGHPLFFIRGLLDLAGGGEEACQRAPTERLETELKQLRSQDLELAACLALLGREATSTELEEMLLPRGIEARVGLERLRWRGLLAIQGERFRLIHEQIARAVNLLVTPEQAFSIHGLIATYLAAKNSAAYDLEAARHCFDAGDGARALTLAERWASVHRPGAPVTGDDVETLRRAAREASATNRETLTLTLADATADALETLGRFEECVVERRRACDQIPVSARPTEEQVQRRRKLGVACHRAGDLDRAVEHFEWCFAAPQLQASPVEALRARADLALLHHFRGDANQALEHARRGTAAWQQSTTAERARTLQSAVNFLSVEGQVLFRRLELDAARSVLEEGVRLARRSRSAANIALLLNNLALVNHLAGRLEAALGMFARAEEIASELGDAAALVLVRCNVAQILARQGRFRSARTIIDEVEEAPAVAQSKRLRLVCLYSRGIHANLLGVDPGEIWTTVETLARDANDPFLERFARLYAAESCCARGEYSRALAVFQEGVAPQLEAPRLARLAWVQGVLGQCQAARETRRALDQTPGGSDLLDAWNQLFAASSAIETGDLEEAEQKTQLGARFFRSAGVRTGEVECLLLETEIAVRGATTARLPLQQLQRVEKLAERARKVVMESPGAVSPRGCDWRAALAEARAAVLSLWAGLAGYQRAAGRGQVGTKRDDAVATEARLRDILARVSGETTQLSSDQQLLLACLLGAAARWFGDLEGAAQSRQQTLAIVAASASRLAAPDSASFAAVNPWQRFGLQPLEPLAGSTALSAAQGNVLARALRKPGAVVTHLAAVEPELRETLAAIDAAEIRLVDREGKLLGKVEASPPTTAEDATASVARIWCRIPGGGAWLVAAAKARRVFAAADEVFLTALTVALFRSPGAAADAAGSSRSSGERTAPLANQAATASFAAALHQTRKLSQQSLRSGSMARLLREEGIVAPGREMLKILRAAMALAANDMPILISGDSGTGKNLIARLIHRLSPRAEYPFLAQNASAIPPELFEADLFGYESGAFTGAEQSRTGYLFQAAGGTFHLEEVGDLEPALQRRFLRVLDDRSVRPLGAASPRTLDVRFVASTQRDLEAMVRRGEFRKDLYYRLGSARIHVPSLAERRDEIAALVDHYWQEIFGARSRFPAAALAVLERHDWPGNVRELVGTLRRLSIEAGKHPTALDASHALGKRSAAGPFPPSLFETQSYVEATGQLEKSYLEYLLRKHSGNLEAIAAALGTTTRSIYRRFERLGLKPGELRDGG